ncbi:TonB-dependent receptor [Sphingosinicella soli]|uniref:Outer membrane receptor protein involved in Fe transport n=1 Tax=Sphingosinicella soli TaxID=333708 RepID=A0A7W7B5L5_9SPHN|nr:TonB-dependent receptor [Sphingosinicella soli]MBB4633347.1 outer membrane receptor protein involved in Fe transport [Sphingosinicella soli]
MQSRFSARSVFISSASAFAVLAASPALAQVSEQTDSGIETIIVTAQRQAESLQDVPIAVSAFSAEAMDRQQIENSSDLQLSLPNVTFSKGNFTASSFTIRGIGDLCVGVTCDSATAVHVNDTPLLQTRLFETEFFDLERIEVLRGPQGTLFGRNATSGVVNLVTAKPDLSGISAAGDAEYGNFNAYKLKGMINLPLTDTLGIRLAGFYQKRDGYTQNLYDGNDIDDRDMYAIRGSLRWEPTDSTTIDLMGYYFREDDNRARIQKQKCQRDPTGILGCLPGDLKFETLNGNATVASILTSREFFTAQGLPAAFALGSLYGTDVYAGFTNPADVRKVNTDFTPTYFTDEEQYQARITQDIGAFTARLTGLYHRSRVDSQQDYNLSVQNRAGFTPGLSALYAGANGLIPLPPGLSSYLAPVASALIPGGPGGELCTSAAEPSGTGSYGGHVVCAMTPQDFDRSVQTSSDWSIEGILTSNFDGPLNFLIGGIYADLKLTENSYYVNAFGLDYAAGVLGAFNSYSNGLPASFLATPSYRNNTDYFRLKSYGIFGEAYYEFSDRAKLTLGIRYNNDKKLVRARTTLANFLAPHGIDEAFDSPFVGLYDADPGLPGNQIIQERRVSFKEWTGRAVFDFKITDDNLLYASYSRGYKSGGINPPLSPIFAVSDSFEPEFIDSFEIGSKNTFLDGTLQLNLTAFYYKYKGLQLSRIVARTSVNDNVDADIYGVEGDAILSPTRGLLFNVGFSYLHTKVASNKFLSNPRDPSGGRSDTVIIKDITNASNCAVVPTTPGNAAGANAFVNYVNANVINPSIVTTGGLVPRTGSQPNEAPLGGTTPFPSGSGIDATGAFSICSVLTAAAASAGSLFGGVTVAPSGVEVNLKGNQLPQAPNYKFSVGAQYTADFDNGMSLVPRVDLTYTGESYGSIFNGQVNKISGYAQINAQLQLNGANDRWYIRGFVQNLLDNSATTGLYVTDASSGLFTNIFTLEPRRYGVGAGFKF